VNIVSRATRFILVAQPTTSIENEWNRTFNRINRDYALLKVLYVLRRLNGITPVPAPTGTKINIQMLAYDGNAPSGPDFSTLADTDTIYVVGHGTPEGLYALGPDADTNVERFVTLFTMNGTLQAKRKNKRIDIQLLSCRAGLGLHKCIARELFNKTGIETNVCGAIGFTFGSWETGMVGLNEVVVPGIPSWMEYRDVSKSQAESLTSAYEGTPITIDSRQSQITNFSNAADALTTKMQDVASALSNTEVNALIDEIEANHNEAWRELIEEQFVLYARAKTASDLGFSMWFPHVSDGYVWVNSNDVTDAQVKSILVGQLPLTNGGVTSIR
jgi:hypothetical protein